MRGCLPLLLIACGAPHEESGGSWTTLGSADTPELRLVQVRDRILGELQASSGSEAYRTTGPAKFEALYQAAAQLAVGDVAVDGLLASTRYVSERAWDAANEREVVVLWEAEPDAHRGALVVALGPARPVVLQSPHPQFDSLTGDQGFELFRQLGARAWLVATAHRCANDAPSQCAATTSVCADGSDAYRESDAAHAVNSGFQAMHEGLLDADPSLVAVQLHGFSRDPGAAHATLADGSLYQAGADWLSNAVAAELAAAIESEVWSCNDPADGEAILCATTNTQGRHLNQAADTCDGPEVSEGTGRFLHVEQSLELRGSEGALNRGLVAEALDAVLPR